MKEALMGLETEYGLRCNMGELHRAFGGDLQGYIVFILKQVSKVLPPENYIEVHKASGEFWTRAGMRCYPDRFNNIEIATPECATFRDLIFQKNTGDRLVQALIDKARPAFLGDPYRYGGPLEIFANNTAIDFAHPLQDDLDNEVTFSCHENYLLRRDFFPGILAGQNARFEHILEHAGVFFFARPVLGGSGHVNPRGTFLLSPRMNWITGVVGGATTSARAIINSRDEPHADAEKFFRYHHIAGDTNITDEICRMKVAFSYWVLRLLERGWQTPSWLKIERRELLALGRAINQDPRLEKRYRLGRKKISAAEILGIYLEAVDKNRESILFEKEDEEIFGEVEGYIRRAGNGYEALVGQSEWATKYLLISAEGGKRSLESFAHPLLRRMSVALHNLDQNPKENPFILIRNRVLPANAEVGPLEAATARAPKTRAYIRGLAVFLAAKFGIPIVFPTGMEWSAISIPVIMSSKQSPPYFPLNRLTPWEVAPSDVKELMQCLIPIIQGREEFFPE